MAAFLKPFIALMAMAALADVATCTNYTVGEPTGSWDLATDYAEWVLDKKFYTGDFIIFKYGSSHDVAEVTKDAYTSCSSSEALSTDKSGNTVFELTKAGTRYFICAVPTHCTSGMKVEINVLPKSSPPTKTSEAPTLPPAKSPAPASAATTPAPSPAGTNNAAQHGTAVFAYSVLGLIGLMLAML